MKLDFRTCVVMLAVFALGYLTCLALPTAEADTDRLEVSEIVADRIIARESIEFENGPKMYGTGGAIYCVGRFTADYLNAQYTVSAGSGYIQAGTEVTDTGRNLKKISIDGDTVISDGALIDKLNAAMLEGHPISDFVLKSEIDDDFCQTFCGLDILTRPPPSRVELTQ